MNCHNLPAFFGFFKLFQLFCLFTQPRTHHQVNKTLFRKGKSSPQALRFWASEISRKATFDIHSIFFPFLGLWWDITQHTIRGTSLDISDFSSLSCPGIAIWVMRLETFSEGLCFVWKSAYKWKIHILDYSHVLWYKKRAFNLFPIRETNGCKSMQNEAITLQGWNVLASTPIAYLGNWKFCKFWPSVNSHEFIIINSESVSL